MITIEIGPSIKHFANEDEAKWFREGFFAALDLYGVWKDGVQTVGRLATPISQVKTQFSIMLQDAILKEWSEPRK